MLAAVLAAVVLAPRASAEPGSHPDPIGDAGGSPIDLVLASHSDSPASIVYTLETAAGFSADQVDRILWLIDLNSATGGSGDLCLFVFLAGSELAAFLFDCDTFEQLGTFDVAHTDGSNVLGVTVPLHHLTDAGQTSDVYSYALLAAGNESYDHFDAIPDFEGDPWVRHDLNAAPLPTTGNGEDDPDGELTRSAGQTSNSRPRQGETIEISGCCFDVTDLDIVLLSDPVLLGSVDATVGGRFSTRVTIPGNTATGLHKIEVSGPGSSGVHIVEIEIEVLAAATGGTGDDGALPATGAPVSAYLVATLIVAAGGEAFLLTEYLLQRRRRRYPPEPQPLIRLSWFGR